MYSHKKALKSQNYVFMAQIGLVSAGGTFFVRSCGFCNQLQYNTRTICDRVHDEVNAKANVGIEILR